MDPFKNARLLTETTSGLLAEAEFLSMARIQPHILDGGGDAVKKADLQMYLWIRQLPSIILAHCVTDLMAVLYTLKF
jgi:hypothetical protein